MSGRRRGPRVPGSKAPLLPDDIARAATMKRYRETRNLTQAELGAILGVSQASVAAYESARTRIPPEVFKALSDQASEDLQVAQDAEEAQRRAHDALSGEGNGDLGPGDMPPEVLEALAAANAAVHGSATPDEAATRLAGIAAGMAGKAAGSLSKDQQASVRDVQLAYGLLAKVLSRLDPILGELVDEQSGELAVSVVQAAEVSPFFDRIVKMLKVGPVSTCIVLHVLLVAQYDERRRARDAAVRQEMAIRAGTRPPTPEPQPASMAERVDPTLAGAPFATAAA